MLIFYWEYVASHKVNLQGVYKRLWFIGLVCVEIISAGEVSSMAQCLSVCCSCWASANRLPLCCGADDAHLGLVEYKHDGQMLCITNTIQCLCKGRL